MHSKHGSFRDFIKKKIEDREADKKGKETSSERKGGMYGKKMSADKKKHGMYKNKKSGREYQRKMK